MKIKVYELAKELSMDAQHLVDSVQRLGIDIKNTMSVLGSEEARAVRDFVRKNRPAPVKSAAPASVVVKPGVTEKRVGATLIRRRAADTVKESPVETAVEEIVAEQEGQPEELAAEVFQEAEETPSVMEATPAETEVEAEAPTTAPELKEELAATPVQVAPPPAVAKPSAPKAPAIQPPLAKRVVVPTPSPRRIYASIIKKTTVEQHLGDTIGPKLEKKERPVALKTDPNARPKPGTPGASPGGFGLRKVKEVEMTPLVLDPSKDAAGRRKTGGDKGATFRSTDYLKRELVHATKKRRNAISRPLLKTQITKSAQHKRVVEMGENITVALLAKEMGIKAPQLISKLIAMGVTATMNQPIDYDVATLVAQEFGYEITQKMFKEADYVTQIDLSPENQKPRGPVVTIMGHVDHGKTSLLDAIRKTQVAAGEAGGITQHIGAYTVTHPKGRITFIDTPGHEAFTAMRARGAKVTDIVILVVSAVDGVMPQTLESVAHAKAAGVPLIVAVNKIDLPDSNADRIKQTLAGHDLNPEEWGGETIYVPVSAKTGVGLDKLLESILLQAEMLELTANYDIPARGSVVEARLDKNRGPMATVLIQHGKLRPGDLVVCGSAMGKVRAMADSYGKKLDEALPGEPVEVLGLTVVPVVGDDLTVFDNEGDAKELVNERLAQKKEKTLERPKMTLEEMLSASSSTEKELRVILKTDVQGSAEALRESLVKIPSTKAKVKILHVATGGIVESDVNLAAASKAVVLGFNVRPDLKALKLAEVERVEVRTYTIIYDLIEDTKKFMEGLLDKTIKEKVIGRAEVREVFSVPKIGVIAGSAVLDGKVVRGCFLRLLRDSRVVYEGKISSLRRFKDDVKEVSQGFECGIGLENFNDVKQGDQFEAFLKEEIHGVL